MERGGAAARGEVTQPPGKGCLDVAKRRVLGAVADALGQVHSLVHFALPDQLPVFLDLARQLREQGRTVQIVREPTGSYSTPLLHAAHAADFAVFLVNPKRAHDDAEVDDGVPSNHDPKDAAVLAWLHAQGRSKRWTPLPESRRELRALLDERDLCARHEGRGGDARAGARGGTSRTGTRSRRRSCSTCVG